MPTSNEMYNMGVQDAEQDTLNAFYYQHYYHYRKGYDSTRRTLNVPLAPVASGVPWRNVLMIAGAVAALVVLFVAWQSFTAGTSSTADTPPAPTIVSPPTPTPAPVMTPTPTPIPDDVLFVGGTATVSNVGEAGLVARQAPGAESPIQGTLTEGTTVEILDGPQLVDSFEWWLIQDGEGNGGWSASGSPDGVPWLLPPGLVEEAPPVEGDAPPPAEGDAPPPVEGESAP